MKNAKKFQKVGESLPRGVLRENSWLYKVHIFYSKNAEKETKLNYIWMLRKILEHFQKGHIYIFDVSITTVQSLENVRKEL
jgi:hypothetical protein